MLSFKNRNILIALIIVIKVSVLLCFIFQLSSTDSFSSRFITNDYSELLGPVDNLIETGTYEYVKNSNIPYADRMPGYIFPYILFRFLFSQNIAVLLLIIFQIIFSIIASLCLYRLINLMTNKFYLSFIFFVLFSLFSFLTPWELWTFPESLSVSCYVVGLFFLFKSIAGNISNLIFAGIFFTWMFFLRGFLGGYFLLPIFFIFYSSSSIKNSFSRIAVFMIPLLIFQLSWTARNYYSRGELIFLQSKFVHDNEHIINKDYSFDSSFKPSILDLRKLISLWGGNNVKYYTNSEMGFFFNEKSSSINSSFPDWIFKKDFQKERLIHAKELVQNSYNTELSQVDRIYAERKLLDYIDETQIVFKEIHGNKIFVNSISRIKNLLINNVVGNWPGKSFSDNFILVKIYKLIVLCVYYLIILFSFISLLMRNSFSKKVKFFRICILSNILYLLFVFSFIINIAEFKYTATLFVSCILLSIPVLDYMFKSLYLFLNSVYRK